MGPKVEAVSRFVETTGGIAAIGHLVAAQAVLEGRAGTRVIASSPQEQIEPPTATGPVRVAPTADVARTVRRDGDEHPKA